MGNRPVNKNRKLGYGSYIGITIIILVSILRFDVGWDYPGYYETVYPSLDTYAIDRFEPFNKINTWREDKFERSVANGTETVFVTLRFCVVRKQLKATLKPNAAGVQLPPHYYRNG